ncbi:class A sortase [Lysinibacillus piscis]|uniref:Class A sortase n=1 Tax=Lysinibacillus piscis TaxID=2518931 RepID=A0ABQ5NHY5_9BACI|nr:class A sortase [Lysinibacillus sp. KH24]GLC87975.1 class A sortase [Lysinibacillus sp. KH24]
MNKLRLLLVILMLVIGLLLLFITPIQNAMVTRLSEQLSAKEYTTETIEQHQTTEADFEFEAVQSLSIAEVLQAQMKVNDMPVIGSIAIPHIDMQLPILKGVGNAVLAVGAGTMKPNQQLGKGNYALAGHYFEDKNILFSPLYQANIGDIIYVTDMAEIYEYKLSEKKIIAATDVFIIDDISNKTLLTLITCAENGTKRLAIQADFIQHYPFDKAPNILKGHF